MIDQIVLAMISIMDTPQDPVFQERLAGEVEVKGAHIYDFVTVFHLRVFLLLGDVLVSLRLVKIAIDVELLGGRITRHRHAGRDRLGTSLLLRIFGRQGWLVSRSDFSPLVESVRFQLMISVLLDG